MSGSIPFILHPSSFILPKRRVVAEHAHARRASAQLGERGVGPRVEGRGAEVEVEVILPRAPAQGAALYLEQVYPTARERLKRVVERAGAVRELEDERELVSAVGLRGRGREQEEARVVLRVVFKPGAQHLSAVDFGGAATRDGRARRVATSEDFGDAPGGVLGGRTAYVGARGEEALALRERDRVRLDRADFPLVRAGAADEKVSDGDDDLGRDVERAVEEQVVDPVDGAGE